MLILFRWWYFLGVGGLFATGFGAVELRHALANSGEPVAIELAELEVGVAPAQPFVRIGAHLALYPHLAFETRQRRGGNTGPDGKITKSCYPIVSAGHAYLQAWERVSERYPTEDIPDAEVPKLAGVRVFVFDTRWTERTQLPTAFTRGDMIEGILTPVPDLRPDERELLTLAADGPVDSTTYLLEAGRRPRSVATCVQYLAVGLGLLAVAVWRFFRKPSTVGAN